MALWRLARPGVIRIPFLTPEGEHVLGGISHGRRIVTYARVFDYTDEVEVVQIMDHWLRRPCAELPAPLLRPVHDEVHHRGWGSGGMC